MFNGLVNCLVVGLIIIMPHVNKLIPQDIQKLFSIIFPFILIWGIDISHGDGYIINGYGIPTNNP